MSTKSIILTNEAPLPIGPYSQAVQAGNMLFVSGQIALKPGTSELNNASIEEETMQVMHNLGAILRNSEYEFAHVVKATIFVKDLSNFAKINEVYGTFFTSNPPARETVEVSRLPKDAQVEISLIAIKS